MKIDALAPWALVFSLTLFALPSLAIAAPPNDSPDWVEEQVPSPPDFSKERLIPIDVPLFLSVNVGVDPETIDVGNDGVVKYVLVITNATGSTTATYEGIRCVIGEVKTYARIGSSGKWNAVSNPTWKPVSENLPAGISIAFARQGGCQNRLAPSKAEIIAALKLVSKVKRSPKNQ